MLRLRLCPGHWERSTRQAAARGAPALKARWGLLLVLQAASFGWCVVLRSTKPTQMLFAAGLVLLILALGGSVAVSTRSWPRENLIIVFAKEDLAPPAPITDSTPMPKQTPSAAPPLTPGPLGMEALNLLMNHGFEGIACNPDSAPGWCDDNWTRDTFKKVSGNS